MRVRVCFCLLLFFFVPVLILTRSHTGTKEGGKNELEGFFLCLIRLIFECLFKVVLYEASTDVEEITRSPDSTPFAFDELSLTLAANKNTCLS